MPNSERRTGPAPLTSEEKAIIASCGAEFYKTNNDPYQVLATQLAVDRNTAKHKYYQYLYTEIESKVSQSMLTDTYIITEILNIVGATGAVRNQILEQARERADIRYQQQVNRRRRNESAAEMLAASISSW